MTAQTRKKRDEILGNPSKRLEIDKTPTTSAKIPEVPGNLTPAAYREWHRFAAILRGMGVLTEADGPSLGRLAESHARVMELTDIINKRGFFYEVETKFGVESKVRPEVKLLRSEERHFVSLCREFGLTPSSRMLLRISYEGVPTDEVEDKYFPQ